VVVRGGVEVAVEQVVSVITVEEMSDELERDDGGASDEHGRVLRSIRRSSAPGATWRSTAGAGPAVGQRRP
jgi:hypothetical protein